MEFGVTLGTVWARPAPSLPQWFPHHPTVRLVVGKLRLPRSPLWCVTTYTYTMRRQYEASKSYESCKDRDEDRPDPCDGWRGWRPGKVSSPRLLTLVKHWGEWGDNYHEGGAGEPRNHKGFGVIRTVSPYPLPP